MIKQLKDIIVSPSVLAEGLRANGSSHVSYKLYTSIERALGILATGELFLSNGSYWNDTHDRSLMKAKNSYAMCFSCSTHENIAMWMLYSAGHGKRGAMLDFPRSILMSILEAETIELGKFNSRGTFETKQTLSRDDFDIFLTDILYVDDCKNGRVKVTLGDHHVTADKKVLRNRDIFYKNYGWAYEKECRLTVRLSDEMSAEDLGTVRIKLSPLSKRKLGEDRLYRSPIFSGGVSVGKESGLTGGIEWEI